MCSTPSFPIIAIVVYQSIGQQLIEFDRLIEFIRPRHSHPRYISRSCSKRWDLGRRGGRDREFPMIGVLDYITNSEVRGERCKEGEGTYLFTRHRRSGYE
jgi:hypothetical protein